MTRPLLSSAVLTDPGTYTYRLVTIPEAVAWLLAGPWLSTIAYPNTADALSLLTGVDVPCDPSRTQTRLEVGQEALVARLDVRLAPEWRTAVDRDYLMRHLEIGVLARVG